MTIQNVQGARDFAAGQTIAYKIQRPTLVGLGGLIIYPGVKLNASGSIYRLGWALCDLKALDVCLKRGDEWVFAPQEAYEQSGDVDKVVFPCGYILGADGDTINLYYGAADTSITMATGSVRALLEWLRERC